MDNTIVNPFAEPNFEIAEYDGKTNFGKFVIGPLERGFGITIGNALRRVLLSSLPGASVCAISVEGANHEFSALEGVEEDVTTIVLNLKELVLKINTSSDEENEKVKELSLDVQGPCIVTASSLVCPHDVEIINNDLVIAHVAEGGKLSMKVFVRNGRGYVTAEANKHISVSSKTQIIATDSDYSPVTKVSYVNEPTRVGHDSSYEKLNMEIQTDGSMSPQDALALAAKILIEHFNKFLKLNDITRDINIIAEPVEEITNKYQDMTIEELDLSVRSYNCLKRAGITSVEQLSQKTEEDMMKVRNLGKKSLKEVKEKLLAIGLKFKGIDIE